MPGPGDHLSGERNQERIMAEITASLVKALRERTGAGMMECKSALVEAIVMRQILSGKHQTADIL